MVPDTTHLIIKRDGVTDEKLVYQLTDYAKAAKLLFFLGTCQRIVLGEQGFNLYDIECAGILSGEEFGLTYTAKFNARSFADVAKLNALKSLIEGYGFTEVELPGS